MIGAKRVDNAMDNLIKSLTDKIKEELENSDFFLIS